MELDGNWVTSRDDETQCLVGRNVARQFGLTPGSGFNLTYQGRTVFLRVAGIVDAGGEDDDQTFVNLPVAQKLAGLGWENRTRPVERERKCARASAHINRVSHRRCPDTTCRPIRQVTEAEAAC